MGYLNIPQVLILLLNLATFHSSLACHCPYPTPPRLPHKPPPKSPVPVKPTPPSHKHKPTPPSHKHKPPQHVPKPPTVRPPLTPKPPIVNPPFTPIPKPPIVHPPTTPKPPIVQPPITPNPPTIPKPPIINPPIIPEPPFTPPVVVHNPPPCPPPPAGPGTCPIDTLKVGACVDVLAGLVHVGVGSAAKDTCCPVLGGLVALDAAVCLCTTIKAKLLNINIVIPIALQLLIDCGKTPPEGFQCTAS